MNKNLRKISEIDFNRLKESGMLWEIFPDAPEFYEEINFQNYSTNDIKSSQINTR